MTIKKVTFDQILTEHAELRAAVEDIRTFLKEPRPEPGQKGAHTWATGLAGKLVVLHDKVFRHFREEDESGFLEELAQLHPRVAVTVQGLKGQHGEILDGLREILQAAMAYSQGQTPESPRLRQRTLQVLDGLFRHEVEETDLIHQVKLEDLGVGD